jgi:ribosomal-protein-alanine N-acetyltransferase
VKIRVRTARQADLDALIELEQRVFATDRLSRASLRRLLASKTARVIVAEVGTRLAGAAVVLFRAHATVARLYSIAVAPPMSGKGVAAVLLAAAERAAAVRKCRCMRLEVHETNAAAIRCYRKSGYRQFGCHAAYYGDGGDALRFEKALIERAKRRPN